MKYDNIKMDLFEKEIKGWIENEKGEQKFYNGELVVNTSKEVIESIIFNVIDTYRRLIRFPDRCQNCTRNGNDHDGECETSEWIGKDYGIFEDK